VCCKLQLEITQQAFVVVLTVNVFAEPLRIVSLGHGTMGSRTVLPFVFMLCIT
jgi:hypothetical protein